MIDLPHDAYEWYAFRRLDGTLYCFWYCRLIDKKWFTNAGRSRMDREQLGRIVREEWIRFAIEQGDMKPSHLLPWEELSEEMREVDRRIGEAVAHALGMIPQEKPAAPRVVLPPVPELDEKTGLYICPHCGEVGCPGALSRMACNQWKGESN